MTTPSRANRVPIAMSQRSAPRTLAFGSVAIALTSDDTAAANWLGEFLTPWFTPTFQSADWQVRLSSSRDLYQAARDRRPRAAAPRPCFAFDQRLISLQSWTAGGRVMVADPERSCFLAVAPFEVDLLGDPSTQRWRFTAVCLLLEIAATRLRRTELDLHSAAVEAAGRALLIVGPKGAGKTTLSFHLLRSGFCRVIANDRVFASAPGGSFAIRGVPTAVTIRAPTVAEFPELRRGLPAVERPYLYSLDELARTTARDEPPESDDLALSPAQLLHQFDVEARPFAPLGAMVFPRIQADIEGWALERLSPAEVSAEISANLYGNPSVHREPTLFEEVDGGASSPSRSLVNRLSQVAPGYRVLLGQRAYAAGDLVARLLETVVPS